MNLAPTRAPSALPAPAPVEVLIKEARRRGRRHLAMGILASVLAISGIAVVAASVGGGGARSPSPHVSSFLPPGYRVAQTLSIRVAGQAQPDIALSLDGPPIKRTVEPATPGVSSSPWWWSYTDVVVLAYEPAASRWTKIYDARSQPWYWTSGMTCCHGPAVISYPFTQSPQLDELTTDGHDYLAFATDAIQGNGGQVMVGLIRLAAGGAKPAYNYVAGYGHPSCGGQSCKSELRTRVVGPPGNQQLRVLYGLDNVYATSRSDDSREFFVDLGLSGSRFHVAYDDYPELGIECGFQETCTVTRVIPGTPGAAVLHRGDVILSVDGGNLQWRPGQAYPYGIGAQGLLFRVLLLHPGDTVRLVVLRGGQKTHLSVPLTWCPNLNFCMGGAAFVV